MTRYGLRLLPSKIFSKNRKKDCCEKQFWLFYIVKGMQVPGKGMEGAQSKAPELG